MDISNKKSKIYYSEESLLDCVLMDLETQYNAKADKKELRILLGSNMASSKLNEIENVVINFEFNFLNVLRVLKSKLYNDASFDCMITTSFTNIEFKKNVCFNNIREISIISFNNCVFTKNITFNKSTFSSIFNITGCTFKKDVDFTDCIVGDKELRGKKRRMSFSLDENIFSGKVYFYNNNIYCNGYFMLNHFFDELTFLSCNLFGEFSFAESTFYKKALFRGIHGKYILTFEHIYTFETTHISFEEIGEKYILPNENGTYQIELRNSYIRGRLDFMEVTLTLIDLRGCVILPDGIFNRMIMDVKCANWETATFFKHEELKLDNIIGALEYKAIEKELYKMHIIDEIKYLKKELKETKKKDRVLFIKYKLNIQKYRWERIAIFLSGLSNNHGQNWGRAIGFTFVSGLLFFALSHIPNIIDYLIGKNDILFYSMARFFLPVDYSGITNSEYLVKPYLLPFYFLGKVAISYGYVEIVQAFRKLK